MAKTDYKNVDEYIAASPEEAQAGLKLIRETIKKALPKAEEVISYQIPCYKYHGYLVYFSGHTYHYSIAFPPSIGVFQKFKKGLESYKTSKSTVQFPADKPLPLSLITEMVKFAAGVNEASAQDKY